MEKATIYCEQQKVFFNDLLVNRPILPTSDKIPEGASKIEVSVLEFLGDKALVLLPNLLSYGQETAMVNIQYLY